MKFRKLYVLGGFQALDQTQKIVQYAEELLNCFEKNETGSQVFEPLTQAWRMLCAPESMSKSRIQRAFNVYIVYYHSIV